MVEKKKKEEKKDETVNSAVKELEKNMFSIRFYPVAVDEQTKEDAIKNIKRIYKEGNETVRQLLLFMLHENISEFIEFRVVHNFEFMKNKNPDADPTRLRMDIYKKMFNYNTSIEGIMEIISILGSLDEGNDSAKVLTYHYARLCAWESEASMLLRNAIIETLGKSSSTYALDALIKYANNTDNERTFNRLSRALEKWEGRLEGIKMPDSKKSRYRKDLKEVLTSKFGGSHYG